MGARLFAQTLPSRRSDAVPGVPSRFRVGAETGWGRSIMVGDVATDHEYLVGPGAPRHARAWAARVLSAVVPPDGVHRANIAEDVMLCVSELVTDTLLANSSRATVRLRVAPGIVRLSVTDDAPRLADSQDPVLYAQLIGWGMVRALSQACGIENYDTGRELWVIFRDTAAVP